MGVELSMFYDQLKLAMDTQEAAALWSTNPTWKETEGEADDSKLHINRRVRSQFKVRPTILRKYVDAILSDSEMNIEWIPDILERKIYDFAILEAMRTGYEEMFKYHGREVCGHHFELELIQSDDVPIPPKGAINKANLNIIVDKLMASPLIDLSWLPGSVKRQLFFNILLLMLTVMHIACTSSECDILGHRIAATFAAKTAENQKARNYISAIDPKSLHVFIDAHLADPEKNVAWLPDYIERSLMTTISVLALTLIEEVFYDFRVNLMSDKVRFHLVPGPAPQIEDLVDIDDIKANLDELKSTREGLLKKLQKVERLIAVGSGAALSSK
jgi:hypothetical protein